MVVCSHAIRNRGALLQRIHRSHIWFIPSIVWSHICAQVHVHREAMVEHKLDEAYLRKRTRVLIRNHVIVTKDAAHRTDGQAQYRQKSMQHLLNLGSRVLKEEVADEGAPGLTGASPDQEADGDCEPGGLPAQPGTEDTNIEDGFPAFEATPFGSAENCEGRDDAYKILSRFQDRAAKLLNTAAFPPSTRNPFSSITVHTAAGARRSYNSKRPHQGQRLQVTRGTTVGNEMYEGRIARQAASSTTWSPVVRTSSNGRVAFLFVGTQAGHILVWKYQCPTFQGRLATMAAGDPFVLMGCVQSHSSGVTSLKCDVMNVPVDGKKPSGTMNVVVLVSGSVTGEVRVHGADAQDLALLPDATLPLGSVLSAWGPIVGPDLRPVTCMALGSLGGPQGERYVVVAVGKTVGTVVLWKSVDVQRLSTVEAAAWIQEGRCTTKGKAHGASTVTGVTWLAAGIACSASQEGGLKSWQFEGANVKEVAPPQYGPSPGLYESPVPNGEMFAFHGIAPSGNGLLLAVLHDRGEKHWDAQASRMNFDRLIGADIRILSKVVCCRTSPSIPPLARLVL
ncbi:unnamed protein product [Ostreobium quekettii]|uniref:Uncharacterized protein n=1 Tax=Ostreobium quekettii TaxID=121088 RepID=A0A8S1IMT3_9CHLO|nr:unnamed protein product [Ostreobium quekettii]